MELPSRTSLLKLCIAGLFLVPVLAFLHSSETDQSEMVLIPAGEFLMGSSDDGDNEKPPHRVYVDAFYIDKYEVTNARYRRFLDATDGPLPCFTFDSRFNSPNQPVVGVSWNDAVSFCRWAGKRLPTEAEWEKAARGTDGRRYPWGNQEPTHRLAVFGGDRLFPVGTCSEGNSPHGLFDMGGNAYEWCQDWYDDNYYRQSPGRNPSGPASGNYRVIRGGCWRYYGSETRCSYRAGGYQDKGSWFQGFRCARSASHGGNR